MTYRENFLRAIGFNYPEWIPCGIGFSPLTWNTYRQNLEKIVLAHPKIFPGYKEGNQDFFDQMPPCYREGEYFRDNWGELWHNVQNGIEGQVVEHPLSDWDNLSTYQPPDILKEEREERDWGKIERDIKEQKRKGILTEGNGSRLFDRLYLLRGFENLMIDFATDAPELPKLIDMFLDSEMKLVNKWLEIGVDKMNFHSDMATQQALMISPAKFRKYIKPMFKKIFQTCRKAGTYVFFSSDGCLLEIVDDLIECGVSMQNPQLGANSLEVIAKAYKGKMLIHLRLDMQKLPFWKPEDIRNQVREAREKLALPEGGLMFGTDIFGADVSLKNIEAICQAFEEFCF